MKSLGLATKESSCVRAGTVVLLFVAMLSMQGCATLSPRERAEKECSSALSKDACVAVVLRRESTFDQCKAAGDARHRQVSVPDGQECRTTGTISGGVYSGSTNCTPKYKRCHDLATMEAAFGQCVSNTDQALGALVDRYRASLAFLQAANTMYGCTSY